LSAVLLKPTIIPPTAIPSIITATTAISCFIHYTSFRFNLITLFYYYKKNKRPAHAGPCSASPGVYVLSYIGSPSFFESAGSKSYGLIITGNCPYLTL
jgi:hypothetical protein